jgi:hypothetical protein
MKNIISFITVFSTALTAFSQKICRSAIGVLSSSYKHDFSATSYIPTSSPISQNSNMSDGLSIQSSPFIHLLPNPQYKVDVIIYPNPTSDIVNIKTTAIFTTIKVIDFSGRTCLRTKDTRISLSHLNPGIYSIEITLQNNASLSQKLILTK